MDCEHFLGIFVTSSTLEKTVTFNSHTVKNITPKGIEITMTLQQFIDLDDNP